MTFNSVTLPATTLPPTGEQTIVMVNLDGGDGHINEVNDTAPGKADRLSHTSATPSPRRPCPR